MVLELAFQNNLAGDGYLDMKGRESAINLINIMTNAIVKNEILDPEEIQFFIERLTGSIIAILRGLSRIFNLNDPYAITLSDFDDASFIDYDTDIPEDGENKDIPIDKELRLRQNALKMIKINSAEQVRNLTGNLDILSEFVVKGMVSGEVLTTDSGNGVKMIITK